MIQGLLATPGVERTQSEIALTERVPTRVLPLVRALPADAAARSRDPTAGRTGSHVRGPRPPTGVTTRR